MQVTIKLTLIILMTLFCVANCRAEIEISGISMSGLIETGEDAGLTDLSQCSSDPYHFVAAYERSEIGRRVHYKNDCLDITITLSGIEINGKHIPWKMKLDKENEELKILAGDKGIFLEHTKYGSMRSREWLIGYFFTGNEIVRNFQRFSIAGGERATRTILDVKSSEAIKEIPRLLHNHLSDYLAGRILSANSDYAALFVNGGLLYKGKQRTLFISTEGVEIDGKMRTWAPTEKGTNRVVLVSKTDRVVSMTITHRQGVMNSITDSSTLSFTEGKVHFSETVNSSSLFGSNRYSNKTLANIDGAASVDEMYEKVAPYLTPYIN